MAAASQLQILKEEATCSICLEYFTDPVFVDCGHTFCLSCISQCWQGLQTDFPCPQCRAVSENKTFRPNRQLASVVEIAKQLQVPSATPQEDNLCREHEEKLKLFCEDDQKPICVVCSMSRDHKAHKMVPIREAAQEYKEKFQSFLDHLKKKLKDLLEPLWKEETKVKQLEAKFKSQKERITNEFEKLQKFLEKEKSCYLSNLEVEEKKSLQRIKETVTKLEQQQSFLRILIAELESKCRQQDVELLKNVKNTLSRYENVNIQHAAYGTFQRQEEKTDKDEEVNLQRKITESLEWIWARSFAAVVTLDPDTAHPWLILSQDGRSVRCGVRAQDVHNTPQRFTNYIIVLGRERLSSGRHYWEVEVEVGDKRRWALGMCDESVSRKKEITLTPEDGFWRVWLKDGEYRVNTSPPTLLTPRRPPRTVGLFLDYEAGRLLVYNVDDRSLLFTFSETTFPPSLRPSFSPGLNDGGRNAGTLRILPVTELE